MTKFYKLLISAALLVLMVLVPVSFAHGQTSGSYTGRPGGTVIVSGTGFTPTGNAVQFVSVTDPTHVFDISGLSSNGTTLAFTIPTTIPAGSYMLKFGAFNSDWSDPIPFAVSTGNISAQSPLLLSITPSSGPAGSVITIVGTNFTPDASVLVRGGTPSTVTPTQIGPNNITFTLPPLSQNASGISVTNSLGTSNEIPFTLSNTIPQVLTDISPATGIAGTRVTLYGTGITQSNTVFVQLGAANPVAINPLVATSTASSTSFIFTPTVPGSYSVWISNGSATSNKLSFNATLTPVATSCLVSASGQPFSSNPLSSIQTQNQLITYSASVSGGNGTYTYAWKGSDGMSNVLPTASTVSLVYASQGTKTATVTVASAGKDVTVSCPSVSVTGSGSAVSLNTSSFVQSLASQNRFITSGIPGTTVTLVEEQASPNGGIGAPTNLKDFLIFNKGSVKYYVQPTSADGLGNLIFTVPSLPAGSYGLQSSYAVAINSYPNLMTPQTAFTISDSPVAPPVVSPVPVVTSLDSTSLFLSDLPQAVTITGSNFTEDSVVTISSKGQAPLSINPSGSVIQDVHFGPSTLTFNFPLLPIGDYSVNVDTFGQTASSTDVTVVGPSFDSINPSLGKPGTLFLVKGTGLGSRNKILLSSGGVPTMVIDPVTTSNTSLTFSTPFSLPLGISRIRVSENGTISSNSEIITTVSSTADSSVLNPPNPGVSLTSDAGPAVSEGGVTPKEGPSGTHIVIKGANFDPSTQLTVIGGTATNVTVSTNAIVADLNGSAGKVSLTLSSGNWTSSPIVFTITASGTKAPATPVSTLVSVYPSTINPDDISSAISINGSNFSQGSFVKLDQVSADGVSIAPITVTPSSMTFKLPVYSSKKSASKLLGVYNLTVLNSSGIESNALSLTVSGQHPLISGISPSRGPSGGTVNITGIFGAKSTVVPINGSATIVSQSENAMTVQVFRPTSGQVTLSVVSNGWTSNPSVYSVIVPDGQSGTSPSKGPSSGTNLTTFPAPSSTAMIQFTPSDTSSAPLSIAHKSLLADVFSSVGDFFDSMVRAVFQR